MNTTAWCLCAELNCFIAWLDRWQTLISGLLALGAAIYAGRKLSEQIRLQRKQMEDENSRYREDRRRSDLGGRALLLDALDALYGYCEQLYLAIDAGGALPDLPSWARDRVREAIPLLSSPGAAAVQDLAIHLQIHQARFADVGSMMEVDRLFDCLRLRSKVVRLFDYARIRSEDAQAGEPSVDDLQKALTQFELTNGNLPHNRTLSADIHRKLNDRLGRERATPPSEK